MICSPLWVTSGPSVLFYPNGGFRAYSGRSPGRFRGLNPECPVSPKAAVQISDFWVKSGAAFGQKRPFEKGNDAKALRNQKSLTGRRGKLSISSLIRHHDTALSVQPSCTGGNASGSSRLLSETSTTPGILSPVHASGVPQLGQNILSSFRPLSAIFE